MRIWIGFGLVIGTFVASLGAVFLSCIPFSKYWQISPDPGSEFMKLKAKRVMYSHHCFFRFLSSCRIVTDHLDLLRRECFDRYISHPDSYSSFVGVNIEARQEDCVDHCAWCRHLRPGLCHTEEHIRPRGRFHPSKGPLVIGHICSQLKLN